MNIITPTLQTESTRVEPTTRFSVVIVTYNSGDHIKECLASFEQDLSSQGKCFLVDNNSKDNTVETVTRHFDNIEVIETGANLGFAGANNFVAKSLKGDYIFLINPDSQVKPGAIEDTMAWMDAHTEVGLAGGLLVDEEGNIQPSARKFPTALNKFFVQSGMAERFPQSKWIGGGDYRWFDHQSEMEVDWVPGAFTCIRKSMLDEIGFFDPRFFLYFEETDLCRRAKAAGWKVYFLPQVKIFHEGGGCSKKVEQETFDVGGSQVMKFRMRAECLYHHKVSGFSGVLANLGVEWAWHRLRVLVNTKPGQSARGKRNYSRILAREIEQAIKDTRWGTYCPPKPW